MPATDATTIRDFDMSDSGDGPDDRVDIVGIGFGPANLSLAIAIEEHNQSLPAAERVRARFIEKHPDFGWHDGMLLPGATMQVSFLKDLVSLRNPTSTYSFLSYLHERGRLTDFINLKTFFPLRREFHDYLSWAAGRVSVPVSYGTTATAIDREDHRFVVSAHGGDGRPQRIAADTIVLGTGIHAVLPDGISASTRVFHNHRLLAHLDQLPSTSYNRFLVVGAGQSAAEVAAFLHDRFPDAEVHSSIRRFGYIPSDDTPYANRIFDPAAVDEYYTAPPRLREHLIRAHASTNYAAVDADLIEDLYRREYEETLTRRRRLFLHKTTEIAELSEGPDGVSVTLRDLGDRGSVTLEVDAVVFATGFRPGDPRDLLGAGIDVDDAFDGDQPVVARDYSLCLPGLDGRVFLNGGVQHSHGLTSSLLSNLSVRSAEILAAAVRAPVPRSGPRLTPAVGAR
ncbi:lysine N(6)-hydroxylase/L-ornithine N(5)-oxygenase family protein [Microbacterium sp. VKM Ac-2923]|uniref:lysine N(6)-hydroxylase/L-ornithine N(5)-oxygenase family protein n=1 Tax=Microbacterium sp. VKM Ac-2923 TaxID=2929476 RepID=UPI001FB401D4|nr:SidA/IucD/PvdA family monooxygenase [Microbacterium sp. VKM Ac-2923]MCJ1708509.1 lysine N(6)-hydroxylase/L-ornithine N(5)-oxygenase family protein [Microbacterium sp. VKM Ac-2923]